MSQLKQKPDDYINVTIELDDVDITSAETKATYDEIKKYVAEHNAGMKVSNLYISQVKRKCGIEVGKNLRVATRRMECLTKNGYGAMVVLSLEAYSRLTDGVEAVLNEADRYASEDGKRYTHEEVFANLRRRANDLLDAVENAIMERLPVAEAFEPYHSVKER